MTDAEDENETMARMIGRAMRGVHEAIDEDLSVG